MVKIKNPRKRSARGNGASLRAGGEQSLGRANRSAPPRGTHGRGHPGHKPQPTPGSRVSLVGGLQASRAGGAQRLGPHFRAAGGSPSPRRPPRGAASSPEDAPSPPRPCGQAWSQNSATGPHAPLLSPSRQRGGAGHLEKKMSWKSGLRMRGGSPQPGSHRCCLLPPPRPPRLPPPRRTYSGSGGSRRPGPTPPVPDRESRAPRTPGRAPAAAGSASAAA